MDGREMRLKDQKNYYQNMELIMMLWGKCQENKEMLLKIKLKKFKKYIPILDFVKFDFFIDIVISWIFFIIKFII